MCNVQKYLSTNGTLSIPFNLSDPTNQIVVVLSTRDGYETINMLVSEEMSPLFAAFAPCAIFASQPCLQQQLGMWACFFLQDSSKSLSLSLVLSLGMHRIWYSSDYRLLQQRMCLDTGPKNSSLDLERPSKARTSESAPPIPLGFRPDSGPNLVRQKVK